ncbi:hypothetical protein sphantq_03142 [Sphingobium sp. AntQ-1]|nr:hypothetical protein sphantq_03142 [Sphingobium sp. AntQ-1]
MVQFVLISSDGSTSEVLVAAGVVAAGATAGVATGTAAGAATGATAAKATLTSSSRKAVTGAPSGMRALVPVVMKPAIGTKAMAATTPAVPVVPLSSKLPVRRICCHWRGHRGCGR